MAFGFSFLTSVKNSLSALFPVTFPKTMISILLCYWFATNSVNAQSEFNRPVQQAYSDILKLKVNNGLQHLKPELNRNPTNACAILVANYADFLSILVSQDEALYK